MPANKNDWFWPLFLSFIRLPMLLLVAAIAYVLLKVTGIPSATLFRADFATLYFTAVNIVCVVLIVRLFKREGTSLFQWIDFKKQRFVRDILYGLLWQIVLYLPFILTVMTVMWLLYNVEMFEQFANVFAPQMDLTYTFPYGITVLAAIISATLFPLLNAPIEEIIYRGYAQTKLISISGNRWIGLFIPAIGFSLQHIVLAPTWEGALIYAAAFFVWGIGAGIIYLFQQRLMPLIVAHFMTNLIFGIFPLVFLYL